MRNLFFLFSVVVFMGCKTSHLPSGGSEGLYQHKWVFSEIGGKPLTPLPNGEAAFLAFAPGESVRVSGSTGCNNLTGTAEIGSGNSLKFSPLATTRKLCVDAATQEQAILTALQQVTGFSIATNTLVLMNGTSQVASLKAEEGTGTSK